jgi:hypothetical protein
MLFVERRAAPGAGPDDDGVGRSGGGCPIDPEAMVNGWAEGNLLCSAGRRELKLGRYVISAVRTGADFRTELDGFIARVRAHEKSGFLALVGGPVTRVSTATEEVEHLCRLVAGAGLVDRAEDAWSGNAIPVPVDMACPVTGQPATYTFFPVAFCRNSADRADPLYDPALSCPFTAINTTSDAFAFALLVRDRSRRHFGCDPFEIDDADAVSGLLEASLLIWQKMSVNTMVAFGRLSADLTRAVSLSPDHRYWTAPHNDPVFAEMKKEPHAHEMPVIYGRALVQKWFGTLFEGEHLPIGLEGQSGGVPMGRKPEARHELQ